MSRKLNSKSLFKFRSFNERSKALLTKNELWFAKPKTLNDPFDCQIEHERISRNFLEKAKIDCSKETKQKLNERIHRRLNNIGVCAFSRARKNQLMWSHYADEHRGFCIGFKEALFYPDPRILAPIDVNYKSKHPFHSSVSAISELNIEEELNDIADSFVKTAIGTKYTYWGYERERRIVRKSAGAHKFTPKHVVSIAFGLNMLSENKKALKKLLQKPEWQHVKWYQAKKSPEKFALDFELVNLKRI